MSKPHRRGGPNSGAEVLTSRVDVSDEAHPGFCLALMLCAVLLSASISALMALMAVG